MYGAAAGCLQAGDFLQFLPVNFVRFLQEKKRGLVGRALLGYGWHWILTCEGSKPCFLGSSQAPREGFPTSAHSSSLQSLRQTTKG